MAKNTNINNAEDLRALQREREERAARVKLFIAQSESSDIADLFGAIKDAVFDREADELFFLSKYYQHAAAIISDVEQEFCNL